MGFIDSLRAFGNKIVKGAKHVAHGIGKALQPIGKGFSNIVHRIGHFAGSILDTGEKVIKGAGDTVTGIGKGVTGLLNSPLLIIGVVVVGVVLISR